MDQCCYNITLKNGKEYIIATNERNIEIFVHEALSYGTMKAYKLNQEYSQDGIKFNTIIILSSEISSIEYYIAY